MEKTEDHEEDGGWKKLHYLADSKLKTERLHVWRGKMLSISMYQGEKDYQ